MNRCSGREFLFMQTRNTKVCQFNTKLWCDGKICICLPFVNLGFVSYCISNECLTIQLGMLNSMFNVMGNQFHICIPVSVFNGMCLCSQVFLCVFMTPQFLTSCGELGRVHLIGGVHGLIFMTPAGAFNRFNQSIDYHLAKQRRGRQLPSQSPVRMCKSHRV